uniref:Uncharacterized protein n=1 Tax=Tanacetum cinerariifolium TaxID=118510 RepID=A0A6L2NNE0_TANCI|nr:hypothetical protein [Tanacetum cinerariifolium]
MRCIKSKRLKKNVDYQQLVDVLALDKLMLEEELSATKSKLKLYDRLFFIMLGSFLMICVGFGLLAMSVWGDDKEALSFEEDDPDDLAFETDDKEGLAFELNDPKALVFLPHDLENMYSGMSLPVKSSYHFNKRLDGPLLDTMSGEPYTISLELLVSKEEGP